MKRLQKAAILVSLIETLEEKDSWCGETNVQKATYFLQGLVGVPLGFKFILYKYGPYSFDLSEELTYLCADSFLDLEVRDPRYGPSYITGGMRDYVVDRFPKTLCRYRNGIDYVADRLGSKRVPELERLATALFVRLMKDEVPSVEKRAAKITKLKPHISDVDAKEAVREVDGMFSEAEDLA